MITSRFNPISFADDTQDEAFLNQIAAWVRDYISNGSATFGQLLPELPGVYPTLALLAVGRLVSTKQIPHAYYARVLEEVQRPPRPYRQAPHALNFPIPHPLDYDWRFAPTAVNFVLDRVLGRTSVSDAVVLLGTPSILRAAIEIEFPRTLTLLDADSDIVQVFSPFAERYRAVHCQVGVNELPAIQGKVVIMDPPWYGEFVNMFLAAASHLSQLGGEVYLALPPYGTRPGIEADRRRMLEFAQQCGLHLQSIEQGVLPYQSPLFERNALAAGGIRNVPYDWRHGDLATFLHAELREPPITSSVPDASDWDEFSLDGVRIRVMKDDTPPIRDPYLNTILDNDSVLPSVSRRDKRRALAQVWTSGNRIFTCEGRSTLAHILHAMEQGKNAEQTLSCSLRRPLNESEKMQVARVVNQIDSLVTKEKRELATFEGAG